MDLKDRLKLAMSSPKVTNTALAAACKIAAPSVSDWLSGKTKSIEASNLLAAAKFLNVSPDWLAMGTGQMRKPLNYGVQEPAGSYKFTKTNEIIIHQYETGGSMGNGLILQDPHGTIKSWNVDTDWIKSNVRSHTGTQNLCIVTGFGDSMLGMFNPGDPLLVDRGVTTCNHDGVYFFRVGNEGYIKRLQRVPTDGGLLIRALSNNISYEAFNITEKMDFQVLGKVLTVWKSEQF